MSIKDQIVKDLQDAMRSGDDLRKQTLRMARASIKNAEMARSAEILDMVTQNDPKAKGEPFDEIRQRRKVAQESDDAGDTAAASAERNAINDLLARVSELDDAGVQDVLRKEIKQRQDSVDAYRKAGRAQLADKEAAEIALLEAYLPKQLSEEEIEAEVREVIAQTGAREMNKVMPAAMARLKGRAEGRAVNRVVTRLLAES
jgi:uncharacterized protein YqeY